MARQKGTTRPNIVFILVDNIGWGTSRVYGGTIPTPRIDKFASEGISFQQLQRRGPGTPTRSAIMTGRHPVRQEPLGSLFPGEGLSGMAPWEYTTAKLLLTRLRYRDVWQVAYRRAPGSAATDQGFDE